jgi:hypothetical protein
VPSPALTHIQDTLYDECGDLLSGKLYITNTSTMISPDGYEIPEGTTFVTNVANGALDVSLVPNTGATPTGTSYSVKYVVTSQNFTETWIVPQSGTPVNLAAVRVLSAPMPSIMIGINQVTPPSGMTAGDVLAWNGSQWVPAVDGQVTSVFGRAGAVTAQSGDYTSFYDPLGAAATAQSNAETFATSAVAIETARAEAAEALLVPSVFGRTGAVTAHTGDYSLTMLGDVNIVSPANDQVLAFDSTSGKWQNQNAAGAVPSGTPVLNMGNQAAVPIGALGTGNTLFMKIPGRSLNCLPTSWKVRIMRGSGCHFGAITILRTLADSLIVVDSTAVTFGGSATPTLTGMSTSDGIALALDTAHDYWAMAYEDSGDTSYWGIRPATSEGSGSAGLIAGYIGGGDYTAVSPIGSGGGFSTGYGCPWDAVLAA